MQLKYHEWNKSSFSANFNTLSKSLEFVAKYKELMRTFDSSHDTDRESEVATTETSDTTRLRSQPSSSGLSSQHPSTSGSNISHSNPSTSTTSGAVVRKHPLPSPVSPQSPHKKAKYINEFIDAEIERKRIGKRMSLTVHMMLLLRVYVTVLAKTDIRALFHSTYP